MRIRMSTLLAVVAVALGVVVIYDQVRISGLEQQLASQKPEPAMSRRTSGQRLVVSGLSTTPEGSNSPSSKRGKGGSNGKGEGSRVAARVGRAPEEREMDPDTSLGSLSTMMKNPAMREFIRQDAMGRLKTKYAPFIDGFGADEDFAQTVYDLLSEREMFAIEKVGKIKDGKARLEERDGWCCSVIFGTKKRSNREYR